MGLQITARLVCDKDGTNSVNIDSPDAPLPVGWMKDQGYVSIGGGDSIPLTGYYCPGCVSQYGTKALTKQTADLTSELTNTPGA